MTPDLEQTELMCSVCGRVTLQEAAYAGRLLTHVTCSSCGTVVKFERGSLRAEYVHDLQGRILSKPRRLLHRASRHPLRLLRSLPGAIIRQPAKFLREFRRVRADEPHTSPDPDGQR